MEAVGRRRTQYLGGIDLLPGRGMRRPHEDPGNGNSIDEAATTNNHIGFPVDPSDAHIPPGIGGSPAILDRGKDPTRLCILLAPRQNLQGLLALFL
jgi:hypothetical protein